MISMRSLRLVAVMSVNKGALDLLDDDELAYVMAHEILMASIRTLSMVSRSK